MKDFESVYNKICLKFKERVDLVNSEYKVAKKEAFKIARYFLIGGALLTIGAYYYFKIPAVLAIIPATLVATLAAYAIKLDKISKSSPTLDGSILVDIYNAVLSELSPGARYIKDRGFDEQVYEMGDYASYDSLSSDTSVEGKLKDGTSFKTAYVVASKGKGEDLTYTFRGYVTDIDLSKNFNEKFMIDDDGISPLEDGNDVKLNVDESFVKSISEMLKNYKIENKTNADVTIINNKLLIRVNSIYAEWITISAPLNKKRLEAFYNNMYEILELSNNIVNKIKE